MDLSRFSIIFGGLLGLLFLTTTLVSTTEIGEIGERCFYLEDCNRICRAEYGEYVAFSSSPARTCKCECRTRHSKETKTYWNHCSESDSCSRICRRTYGRDWGGRVCSKPSSNIGIVIDIKSDQNQDEKNFNNGMCTCFCYDFLKEIGF